MLYLVSHVGMKVASLSTLQKKNTYNAYMTRSKGTVRNIDTYDLPQSTNLDSIMTTYESAKFEFSGVS